MISIKVGTASCGMAAGAEATLNILRELAEKRDDVIVSETGCIGMCYAEPLVEITIDNKIFMYGNVSEKIAPRLFDLHIVKGKPIEDLRIEY